MGDVGDTIVRGTEAFATGGLSEVARAGVAASKGDLTGAVGSAILPMGPGAAAGGSIGVATAAKALGVPSGKGIGMPQAISLPDIPSPDQAAVAAQQDEAERKVRAAAANKTNTVATSSQGVLGDATVNRPSLIGRYTQALLG